MQQRTRESVIGRNWQLVNDQLISHYREVIIEKSGANKEMQSENVA